MDTCILCKSKEKDELQYGEFLEKKNIGVHTFCLYLSSNLPQNGADDEGFLGFLEADIKDEVRRTKLLNCIYCRKPYANIGCCQTKCRKTFHLICGIKNLCENQFSHDFRSYCHLHIRKCQQRPSAKETCLICFDNIITLKKFHPSTIIQAPCCRNGWFHKLCLQKFAKTSGYFFKCPLCNDSKVFREKLPSKGIFIPNQDAAWELEPNAFAELLERPSECAAITCENRQGRKVETPNNSFVLCSTCGSTAMHRQCLPNGGNRFHCVDCTIAMEDADSGRESLNSQQNHGNDIENDDDEAVVDVCNVSDKEDLEIIRGLIDNTSNKESEQSRYNTRDSGLSQDQNERHRQKSRRKIRRIISETESSEERPRRDEKPKHSRSTKTKLYKKPNRIINFSSSSEEEQEKIVPKTKQLLNRYSSSSDEVVVIKSGNKRTLSIQSDTDDQQAAHKIKRLEEENFQNRPSSSKNCKITNFIDDDSSEEDDEIYESKNISTVSIASSSCSDDPLENFTTITEEQKNISCIALRTRRKKSLQQSKDTEINSLTNKKYLKIHTDDRKSTTSEEIFKIPQNLRTIIQTEDKKQPENIQTKSVTCEEGVQKPKHKNEKSKSRRFKPLNDDTNALNISCIAKRTRRKSMACMRSNSRQEKENNKETATTSSLNVSCIAVRTRRQTICAQSAKEHFEMSQNYDKFEDFETDETDESEELEIITEDAAECSVWNEDNEEEEMNTDDFIVSDGYEEKDSNFDISCIANRTRKRKSSSSKSSSSSASTTSASSTSSSSSSSNDLSNVKLSKRCSKRLLYFSSEESSSSSLPPYESRSTFKSKISASGLIEKFPQQNYSAFLSTTLASSKLSSNSSSDYYPNNQYHPHSNNRKRI